MKICILARGIPPDAMGGMEVHTQDLIRGLNKKGHRVNLINLVTPNHPEGTVSEAGENLRVFYVGDTPYINAKFDRASADLIKKLNAEDNFDVVHSQEVGYGYGFARYSPQDMPFVVTMHGVPMTEIRDLLRRKSLSSAVLACRRFFRHKALHINARYKIVLNRANKVVAVGSLLLRDIRDQYDMPMSKLTYIPNGVDTERFKPQMVDDLRSRWDLKDGPVILAAGRIDRYKGFDILLKSFPAIRRKWNDAKLFIVGEGPFSIDLKKMSKRMGSEGVIFTGKISHQEMPQYYNLADTVVFPTMRTESFGLAVAEAMACGKAVIASRIGEIPEFVDDNSDGILIKPGDVEDLAKNMIEVLNDKDLAIQVGMRAREKVLIEFSLDKMVERTEALYRDVF